MKKNHQTRVISRRYRASIAILSNGEFQYECECGGHGIPSESKDAKFYNEIDRHFASSK